MSNLYGLIKEIEPDYPETWRRRLFITIDIDWCSDLVLKFTYDLVERYSVPVTWFATHESKMLDVIRNNDRHEVGIHPNFNMLLNGDHKYGSSAREIIQRCMRIVPEAKSVRSHSVTQSTGILTEFRACGLQYDCNHFIPRRTGMVLHPWSYWAGDLIKVPYMWEDDVHCMHKKDWNIKEYLCGESINVFDFHPIHVYLNTERIERYYASKVAQEDGEELKEWVNSDTPGVRTFLIDLLTMENKWM